MVGPTRVFAEEVGTQGAPAGRTLVQDDLLEEAQALPPYFGGQLAQIQPPSNSLAVQTRGTPCAAQGSSRTPARPIRRGGSSRARPDLLAERLGFGGIGQIHAPRVATHAKAVIPRPRRQRPGAWALLRWEQRGEDVGYDATGRNVAWLEALASAGQRSVSHGERSRTSEVPAGHPPATPEPGGLRNRLLIYAGNPRCGGQGVYTRHLSRGG